MGVIMEILSVPLRYLYTEALSEPFKPLGELYLGRGFIHGAPLPGTCACGSAVLANFGVFSLFGLFWPFFRTQTNGTGDSHKPLGELYLGGGVYGAPLPGAPPGLRPRWEGGGGHSL